jgi:hypothetical protein
MEMQHHKQNTLVYIQKTKLITYYYFSKNQILLKEIKGQRRIKSVIINHAHTLE